jgi:K+ transporter
MVYGDIGVSPLFVLRSIFVELLVADGITLHAGEQTEIYTFSEEKIVGILSLLLWVITLICCLKYIVFVLRGSYY